MRAAEKGMPYNFLFYVHLLKVHEICCENNYLTSQCTCYCLPRQILSFCQHETMAQMILIYKLELCVQVYNFLLHDSTLIYKQCSAQCMIYRL